MLTRLALGGVFLITQLVFFCCSQYFGYKRPLVLLEWFIPFIFLYFRRKFVFALCSVLLLTLEGLLALCQIYLLVKPLEWLYMFKYVGYANTDFLILGGGALIVFLGFFIYISKIYNDKKQFYAVWYMMIFSVMANFIPSLNGIYDGGDSAKLYRQEGIKVLGSSILMLERFTTELDMNVLSEANSGAFGNKFWGSRTASSYLNRLDVKQDKLLFIVVESWGVPHDKALLDKQISPFLDSKSLKLISRDSVDFLGSTVSGEMRELCGLYVNSIGLSDLQMNSAKCLPSQFQEEGYIVNAYHAASGSMYDRNKWYQTIGFKHPNFFMEKNWDIKRCYSFPGWCDIELLDFIWDEIPKGNKTFSYWLTLNSHFPYSERDISQKSIKDITLCSELNIGDLDAPVCRNFILNRQLFRAIAEKSERTPIHNLTIVLVGDHMPIFIEEKDKNLFSKEKVPMIILKTVD